MNITSCYFNPSIQKDHIQVISLCAVTTVLKAVQIFSYLHVWL